MMPLALAAEMDRALTGGAPHALFASRKVNNKKGTVPYQDLRRPGRICVEGG
jgi:hypothetical protein